MDIRRGLIRSFNPSTYEATVEILGSRPGYLTIPVAKHLAAALLPAGAKVAVLFFDETNPNDAVVLGPYDGTPESWIIAALLATSAKLVQAYGTDATSWTGAGTDWTTDPNLTVTITILTSSLALLLLSNNYGSNTARDRSANFRFIIDDTITTTGTGFLAASVAAYRYPGILFAITSLSAGDHTIKMQARKYDAADTLTVYSRTINALAWPA